MSLDDIIAKSSKRNEGTRGRPGTSRGGSRGANSRRRDGKAGGLKVIVRKEIQKSASNRRPLSRGRQGFTEQDEPGHIKHQKLEGNMAWGHDKAPKDAPARRPFTLDVQPPPAAVSRPVGSSQL
ncbi:hypothetical protein WJX84_007728 [Apatococcus fuscideae]